MTAPALVMVAPNGARRSKADHPALPVTIEEVATAAARCREAGADAVHAHLRDAKGVHSLDADGYRDLIAAIRREAGREMVVQITTEAVGRFTPAEQRAVVDAVHPDAASVALAEMVPDAAHEAQAADFYARCAARDIAIQHILYAPHDVERLSGFVQRGIVPDKGLSVLFVLGRYTDGQQSDPADLMGFLDAARVLAPTVMVCAFGRGEIPALAAALALGGHARAGFENSLTGPDGALWPDNTHPVAAVAGIASTLARARPSRAEALGILGLG
ncbi:3-keto-5-aminohexanoate cleavage protein [Pelagibacterium sediminicola]|uniref:3-keto-5-aminohexanoate cleavage protein n=1 Tax=Pelagibacterium sediminicola TaxID=2248761 RepID=UPI000E318D4F|nr:3-keto-5-aminohexanoate cleavage protein [Pelagibacterium sediminicola]